MSDPEEIPLKRCYKCHEIKPITAFYKDKRNKDGLQHQCKACIAESRAANAENIREYKRAWYAANAENIREYNASNREARREYSRAYAAANADHIREYNRAHRAANPEFHRAKTQRRLARLKGNGGNVTAHQLATKRASQNGFCFYCRMPHDPQALTIDHVIPLDQGGPHIIANIVFACGICNSSKGNRTPDEWTDRWYERKSK